jgi:hypothetical protein
MFPEDSRLEGAPDDGLIAGPAYLAWLRASDDSGEAISAAACAPRPWAAGPYFKRAARRYLSSVPPAQRAPRRWGWKNPKAVFHLEVLQAAYADAVFVHAVRNPLDLAAAQWEHLHNRALEFAALQGGYAAAARRAQERCAVASSIASALEKAQEDSVWLRSAPLGPLLTVPVSGCAPAEAALRKMASCKGTTGGRDEGVVATCARGKLTSAETKPNPQPWRCLQTQLWAEINAAVGSFGARCLGGDPSASRSSSGSVAARAAEAAQAAAAAQAIFQPSGAQAEATRAASGGPKSSGTSSSSSQATSGGQQRTGGEAASYAAWARRNLLPRYLLWPVEDALGLRGAAEQLRFATGLVTFLDLPLANVTRGLVAKEPATRALHLTAAAAATPAARVAPLLQPRLEPEPRRRLGYGKYVAGLSLAEASLAAGCAEAAAPGAMASFGYAPHKVLQALAQTEPQQQQKLAQYAHPPHPPLLSPPSIGEGGDSNGGGGGETSLAPQPVVSLDVILLVGSLATFMVLEWRRRDAEDEIAEGGVSEGSRV